jgi:hypothetical protein
MAAILAALKTEFAAPRSVPERAIDIVDFGQWFTIGSFHWTFS